MIEEILRPIVISRLRYWEGYVDHLDNLNNIQKSTQSDGITEQVSQKLYCSLAAVYEHNCCAPCGS